MKILTIEEIKAHTRIDSDAEDEMLEIYGASAEETVLNLLGRTLDEVETEYGEVPVAVKHAMLMLVDHSYQMRSPVTTANLYAVPYTLEALIKPYMRL